MIKETIIELFKENKFDELNEFLKQQDLDEISNEIKNFDLTFLVDFFPKINEELSAQIFIKLPNEIQYFLAQNISKVEFEDISEELLDSDVEDNVKNDVLNEIILKAEVDTRREKLLEIIDSIENGKFTSIKPILSEMRPIDIAEIINETDEDKALIIFRMLPKYLACDTFIEMDSDLQEQVIKAYTDSELSGIINKLFVDDTIDILEEMPSNVVRRILKVAGPEMRESINKLMGFPKDSAGSIMTPECITLRTWMTAEQALEKIRKQALNKETIYTCYVTDDEKKLLGIVTAKDIILHEPTDKIEDFMHENIISAHTHTDKEEVSNLLTKYDLLAIPIVDSENRINGIVTIDDAVDVIQEEVSEDISKMAAIMPTTTEYLQTNVFSIYKSRVPWLLVLLISATFTGLIINNFEGTLRNLSTLLFACIPMLMDSGGNAGSQASVTIIRSLALNELEFKDIFKVLWKEIRVSLLLALTLAICCFAKLQLIDKLIFGYEYSFKISMVVSLALFFTIMIAKLVGACLPLIAKKLKLDPAVVASPFITTIVDALSLLIFCGISVALL